MSKCPVCGTELKIDTYWIEHIECEYSEDCPNCHYNHAFAYGGYLWEIGGKEFGMHYTMTDEERAVVDAELTTAIQEAKEGLNRGRAEGDT